MDDLTDQLRALGQATEDAVTPVTADAIQQDKSGTDLDAVPLTPVTRPARPRRRGAALAVAAAFVVLAGGFGALLASRSPSPVSVDSATASTATSQTGDSDRPFEIPTNDNGWEKLRYCESSSTYDVDTGNTFYGAYQFTKATFWATAADLGLIRYHDANPAQVPPEIQDAAANALYLERGSQPWPICGRHIAGPMITPVVPQWLGQLGLRSEAALVFLTPGIGDDRIAEIEAEILDIVSKDATADMVFFDAETSHRELLAWLPSAASMVPVEDTPASFRFYVPISESERTLVQALDGVQETAVGRGGNQPDPTQLHIPSLGLTTPVYQRPTTFNLERGPAWMGGTEVAPIIGGFGSVDGAVFARLGELQDGDIIELTSLVDLVYMSAELTRRYQVITSTGAVPGAVALDELPLLVDADLTDLTLVSDVAGDPTRRLVIRADALKPDPAGYPGNETGS